MLDVMMPHLDGWQVAARLREHEQMRQAGLIFVSALGVEEAGPRAQQLGGLYVPQPFNPVELLLVVREASPSKS